MGNPLKLLLTVAAFSALPPSFQADSFQLTPQAAQTAPLPQPNEEPKPEEPKPSVEANFGMITTKAFDFDLFSGQTEIPAEENTPQGRWNRAKEAFFVTRHPMLSGLPKPNTNQADHFFLKLNDAPTLHQDLQQAHQARNENYRIKGKVEDDTPYLSTPRPDTCVPKRATYLTVDSIQVPLKVAGTLSESPHAKGHFELRPEKIEMQTRKISEPIAYNALEPNEARYFNAFLLMPAPEHLARFKASGLKAGDRVQVNGNWILGARGGAGDQGKTLKNPPIGNNLPLVIEARQWTLTPGQPKP